MILMALGASLAANIFFIVVRWRMNISVSRRSHPFSSELFDEYLDILQNIDKKD